MAPQCPVTVTQPSQARASRASLIIPDAVCGAVIRALDFMAQRLVFLGVSANAITASCLVLGCAGGVLIGFGKFGFAAVAIVIASLGDALDGLVARRSNTVSVAGALLDATGDRYQEFFLLGGLAVYFRGFLFGLIATLLALAGSFMVSYSSAKAEAMGVPVPPGLMRRPERAVCMCVATALMVPWAWLAGDSALPAWAASFPMLAGVSLIAVIANVSAARRMHGLSRPGGASSSPLLRVPVRAEVSGASSLQAESPSGAVQGQPVRSP
jgi:CDP-diacylglycerol--glycerol-3-phosphate 3-phosphatidyltransferase